VDLRAAEPFEAIQREAAEMLTGRIIVGHSISNDLQVCSPWQKHLPVSWDGPSTGQR